jgi:hypothetical protein
VDNVREQNLGMASDRAMRSRDLWRLLEPIHAVTYFSPEPLGQLKAVGYRGFWMGYFAGRAAPLGVASAEVVHAIFYNFAFDHVARALPDAWRFAALTAAIDARQEGSAAALRRHLGGEAALPGIARAADLASRAARHAPLEGRPLFAANRALPEPDEPLARLWHAATLLREHRGDGHVAVLVTTGIGGRDAHVLHALSTGTPASVYSTARNLDDQEWAMALARLAERGLADPGGTLTDAGRATKQEIEDRTDERAATAYAGLSDGKIDELIRALRPVTAAVVTAGEIPRQSPMGLDLGEALR